MRERSKNLREPAILTIGHSTRPIEAFLHLLEAHGVKHLVDVRTIPRSRYNPQFNDDALAAALHPAGIAYANMKALGGLRLRQDGNDAARGYGDAVVVEDGPRGLDRDHPARADKEVDRLHFLKRKPRAPAGPFASSDQIIFPGP